VPLQVNYSLASIARKINPMYLQFRAAKDKEMETKDVSTKLRTKYTLSEAQPLLPERYRQVYLKVKRFWNRLRILIRIVAPIVILVVYLRHRRTASEMERAAVDPYSRYYWQSVERHRQLMFSYPFDSGKELFIVRLAQLLSLVVGL